MAAALITLGVLIVLLAVLWLRGRSGRRELRAEVDGLRVELARQLERSELKARHAVATSRSVHLGHISEQLAPLLPGFGFNPKDAQWIGGGPVDMIVWDGLEAGGEVEIVLLDVKTGRAVATPRQRRIREAAEAGRVRFAIYRPDPLGDLADAGELGQLDGPTAAALTETDRLDLDGQALEAGQLGELDGAAVAVVLPVGDRLEFGSQPPAIR